MVESLSCTIEADINAIPNVSVVLDQTMRANGFAEEEILDTQLAVEEAITNIIRHGYAGTYGEILITCRTTHGHSEVQIEDSAPPFNPLSIPDPDISDNIEDRKIGGLGVFLIRQVMDEVVYRYESGKNILVLIKKKKG